VVMAFDQKNKGCAMDDLYQPSTEILETSPAQQFNEGRDLGKRVSERVRELFVVCDPAEALRQHFEMGVPPFMVLHDIGCEAATAFLAGLIKLTGWGDQQLIIRRQGLGTTLTTLRYVDSPIQSGAVRIYLCDAQTDPAIRRQLSAAATGNVLVCKGVPGHDVGLGLVHVREALLQGAVKGHRPSLFVLAQGHDVALEQGLLALQHERALEVELGTATPSVSDQWGLLAVYWNRVAPMAARGLSVSLVDRIKLSLFDVPKPQVPQTVPVARSVVAPSVQVAPLVQPLPAVVPSPPPMPPAPAQAVVAPAPLDMGQYVEALVKCTGASSACLFKLATREVVAHSRAADGVAMAEQGFALLGSVGRVGTGLGLGRSVRDVQLILGDVQVVVRPARVLAGAVLMVLIPRAVDVVVWRRAWDQLNAQAVPARVPKA
jgi:hypothetical protein